MPLVFLAYKVSIMKIRYLALLFISLIPLQSQARTYCGVVTIEQMLTGARHGAMMRVSGSACNWVCLDPDAEILSERESNMMFSFLTSKYLSKQPINLTVFSGSDAQQYATACNGPYPVVEDVRTP